MHNPKNNYKRRTPEAASAAGGRKPAATRPGQTLPPEFLLPCLADLKRQIALRQAMP